MTRIWIDRRAFVLGTLALSVSEAFADSHLDIPDEVLGWLKAEITAEADLRSSEKTGALPEASATQLSAFGRFLAKQWGMDGQFADLSTDLTNDLILHKTVAKPSYLTEYTEMAAILDALTAKVGDQNKSFEIIAFWKIDPEPTNLTRIGRFRQFVFREFAYYIVSQGGFKRFKPIKNYKGYIAGKFTEVQLPYRGLDK